MQAKEYLARKSEEIKAASEALDRKRERLIRLRSRLVSGVAPIREMPGGGGAQNTGEDRLSELADLKAELKMDAKRIQEKQKRLTMEIAVCEKAQERAVLELRYVDGLSWGEIAGRLHYSRDGVFKLHKRALNTFERRMKK